MALAHVLHRQTRARKTEEDVDDVESLESELELEQTGSEAESNSDVEDASQLNDGVERTNEESDDTMSSSESESADPQTALSSISFGALASAQASLGPKRKRNERDEPKRDSKRIRSTSPFLEADERRAGKKSSQPTSTRLSKHAPTEVSSKKAVSRRRFVIAVPTVAPRDPRFLSLSGKLDENKVKQNYSFLNEYRASEIAELKSEIRRTKDVSEKERLKKQLKPMEDRERSRQKDEQQRTIIREHRKVEKKRVEEGKKPFFLKKNEIKRQALIKTFEGLGEKKVEKVMERRRKKKASKERKAMPDARRSLSGPGGRR